jgi:peptidoglycan hydrolase CwlO-like protein
MDQYNVHTTKTEHTPPPVSEQKTLESKVRTLEEYVQQLEKQVRKSQREITRLKEDINAITMTLRRG